MSKRSVMTHTFSQVPRAVVPRSQFNRSHGYKTTFNAGYLIPFYCDEALPGDTFNVKATLFARLTSPLSVPIMDNLFIETFFFAVPYRLVWAHWEKFNGAQDNPGDSTSFLVPQVELASTNANVGTLWDYFGLPVCGGASNGNNIYVNALHSRSYNLIWNTWFRDQNLQASLLVDTGDGPDNQAAYVLQRRGKRHDYFTSALPWPQKGSSVSIPLGTTAPVVRTSNAGVWSAFQAGSNTASPGNSAVVTGVGTNNIYIGGAQASFDPNGGLYTDLSSASAASINSLRQAFQIQKLLERDARGGTRYTEILRSHFGVISPDQRLQRPEYLGGASRPIMINPVVQSSATNAQPTPQGNVAAFGVAHSPGHGFVKSFTEHCILIGLVNVRADLNYQQGLNRMWTRQTRYDFYWPSLSHLGEQAVLNQEIYATGALPHGPSAQDLQVFGYQERYAEYRYKPSIVTGQFRSSAATPLDMWHLAQNFGALPVLNASFIQDNPPMSRVKAVTSVPDFLLDVFFDIKTARPMPVYSVPGLIDHF